MNSKQEIIDRYTMGGVEINWGHDLSGNRAVLPRSYHHILNSIPIKLKNIPEPLVLDLAVGNGQSSDYLERKKMTVVRSDLSYIALEASDGLRTRCSANDELPFTDNTFNAIHFKDALVHIEDKKRLFREIRRVLKPSGVLLLTTSSEDINKTFFTYMTRIGESMTLKQMFFRNLSEYCSLVEGMKKNPKIVCIDPPYFNTKKDDVDLNLCNNRLEVIKNFTWIPNIWEHDWYEGRQLRSVYIAIKK